MPVVLRAKKLRRISKQQLCILFNCYNGKQETDTKKLQRKYLTNDFIKNHLKITKPQYNKIKEFSIKQTKMIIKHFEITSEELQQFL